MGLAWNLSYQLSWYLSFFLSFYSRFICTKQIYLLWIVLSASEKKGNTKPTINFWSHHVQLYIPTSRWVFLKNIQISYFPPSLFLFGCIHIAYPSEYSSQMICVPSLFHHSTVRQSVIPQGKKMKQLQTFAAPKLLSDFYAIKVHLKSTVNENNASCSWSRTGNSLPRFSTWILGGVYKAGTWMFTRRRQNIF